MPVRSGSNGTYMYVLVVFYILYVCIGIFRDEMNRRSNERRDPDRDRNSPPFHSVEPLPPGAYRPRSWLRR